MDFRSDDGGMCGGEAFFYVFGDTEKPNYVARTYLLCIYTYTLRHCIFIIKSIAQSKPASDDLDE